jgi:hypothetical protein
MAALAGALAVGLGGGLRGDEATALPVADEDVRQLVDEVSAGSSLAAVRHLEGSPGDDGVDGRTSTLLGLGYQQLARETADPTWLLRADEALRRA